MKNLYIIRHGKATHEIMPDIKRPLIEKGVKRTKKRAAALQEAGIKPDLIVSSPAIRAFQTAEILAKELQYPDEIQINQFFYFYDLDKVLQEIRQLPDDKFDVFIVGHNPIWTELADMLSENGIWHVRTSGIVGISFDTDTWKNFEQAGRRDKIIMN